MTDGRFAWSQRAVRVVFAAGAAGRLGEEIDRAGWSRVWVLSTPGRRDQAARLVEALRFRIAGHFAGAEPHVPSACVDAALAALAGARPDGLLAIGGGSAIGLAKAVALSTGLPIAAVPTTYAGSEMTDIWGLTAGGVKRTGRDARVAPALVVYDPELTITLPPAESAASGMNAMAHAVEALYAADAHPVALAAAESAAGRLARSLPDVVARPSDGVARAVALEGAYLAGTALGQVSMGLHHRLCHVLGGAFGLPHARTHAALLPHVAAFNAPAAEPAMVRLAAALGVSDAAAGLAALAVRLGLRDTLRALGLAETDLDRVAGEAAARPCANPRPVTADAVRAVLDAAW